MTPKTIKVTAKKAFRLIDLEPGEAGVLSLVADYAKVPGFKTHLFQVLDSSTPRARAIGHVILKKSARARPVYRMMAKRFVDARANNVKNARILKASTPRGLVDRGL
jgi:hypothetical protein